MSTKINELPNNNPPPVKVPPINSDVANTIVNNIKESGYGGSIPLPPQDIPQMPSKVMIDNETNVNNIPLSNNMDDYIKQYDNMDSIHNNLRHGEDIYNYEQYSSYAFITAMYVLLQLPNVRETIRKYLPSLFGEEGAPTISYNILLGLILATLFYIVDKQVLTKQ